MSQKKIFVVKQRGYRMDDLISRQAAIDACIKVRELHAYDEIEEIKHLPSAQPEQRWIPCSERLPEANGRYLVTRGLNACGAM